MMIINFIFKNWKGLLMAILASLACKTCAGDYIEGSNKEKVAEYEALIKENTKTTAVYDSVYTEHTVKIAKVPIKTYSIKYKYEVNGVEYEGEQSTSKLPESPVVEVYYLKDNPSIHDINPTSFSDPYNGSEKGFSERIDIYIKDSSSPKSHTISMQFKDRVLKEINKLPANQPITLIYNHLSLRDLFDDWPIWCENSINVTLKPNEEYILKAETEFEPTETKLLFGKKKVPSLFASCSLHLIDKKTGKIITEQFTLPIEKRKPIGMY